MKKIRESGRIPSEIKPGQSAELLKALHILTRDGKLNQDSRRKLKQVYHLTHFIEPLLLEIQQAGRDVSLVDFGAGKSYLGFILYDLFFKSESSGWIYGVETHSELVGKSKELAGRLDFLRMRFFNLSTEDAVNSVDLPETVEVVTALHACDTATDDAIYFALRKEAKFIVLVPCCQAEVASVLRRNKNASFSKTSLSELWRHPIHTRELGALVTNVLRCLQLEAHGYQVSVTELTGWDHSLKNELIIARKTNQQRGNAKTRIAEILHALNLEELAERLCLLGNHE